MQIAFFFIHSSIPITKTRPSLFSLYIFSLLLFTYLQVLFPWLLRPSQYVSSQNIVIYSRVRAKWLFIFYHHLWFGLFAASSSDSETKSHCSSLHYFSWGDVLSISFELFIGWGHFQYASPLPLENLQRYKPKGPQSKLKKIPVLQFLLYYQNHDHLILLLMISGTRSQMFRNLSLHGKVPRPAYNSVSKTFLQLTMNQRFAHQFLLPSVFRNSKS